MRALILAAALALPATANAAVMTFDDLPSYYDFAMVPYVEDGMRMRPIGGDIGHDMNPGAQRLINDGTGMASGAIFDLVDGRQFTHFRFDASGGVFSNSTRDDLTITAFRENSVVFTETMKVASLGDYIAPRIAPADRVELTLPRDALCGEILTDTTCMSVSVYEVELTPVPIPATAGLLGAAVAGLGLWRRRRA